MALSPAQRAARRAKAQANRTRNSQLLASYAADPSRVEGSPAQAAKAEANRQQNSTLLAGYAANPASIPNPDGSGPIGGRPLDPAEQAYQVSAGRNLQLSAGEATYQRGQLEQTFGYGDSGAANPYSRAALLQESFNRSKRGTTNSYASSGQLNSGAYGRMQGENDRNYSIASDQNRRQYDQAVHGVNYEQAQNTANYGIGVDDAAYQALLRSLGLA